MDSKRNTTSINKSPKDILKATNYVVAYHYKNNSGYIFTTFNKDVHQISYKDETLHLNNTKVPSSKPSSLVISHIFLRKICLQLKYPWQYVSYTYNDKVVDSYSDMTDGIDKQYMSDLYRIGIDVYNYGLRQEFIDEAKDKGMLDNLLQISSYIFGLKIGTINDN